MNIIHREDQQLREHALLSPDAAKSDESEGRARSGEPDFLRTEFQRDRDRASCIAKASAACRTRPRCSWQLKAILYFRTRLTHTLEVAQIARTIARALGLNEDLAEAISLGHESGAHPVRPYRRGRLGGVFGPPPRHRCRVCPGCRPISPQRAEPARGGAHRERRARASTSPSRCATASCAIRARPARRNPRGAHRGHRRPHRLREPRHRRRHPRRRAARGATCPPRTHAVLGADHSARIETLVLRHGARPRPAHGRHPHEPARCGTP